MAVISAILSLIVLIASVVQLENQRKTVADCVDYAAEEASSEGSQYDKINCGGWEMLRNNTVALNDWYKDYYGVSLAGAIVPSLFWIVFNLILLAGVVTDNRCLLLPWLIFKMIEIVFLGIGTFALLILLGFVLFATSPGAFVPVAFTGEKMDHK